MIGSLLSRETCLNDGKLFVISLYTYILVVFVVLSAD
jgi:hypothetical protein